MSSIRLFGALTCFTAMFVAGCTIAPVPTPDKFERGIKYNALQRNSSCGLVMPPGIEVKETQFYPNGGGDLVTLGGPARIVLFDSSSPTTVQNHDTIVLLRAHPSGYDFVRNGADLLICGRSYWQELLVIRHYCFNATAEPPWNNQFEEITFPHARETWIADDLYDALGSDKDFPGAERVNKVYRIKKEHARSAAEKWRVRPFRDVLPLAWFTATLCDEDPRKVSAD